MTELGMRALFLLACASIGYQLGGLEHPYPGVALGIVFAFLVIVG